MTTTADQTTTATDGRESLPILRNAFFWPFLVFSVACFVPLYLFSSSTRTAFAFELGSPLSAATIGAGYAAAVVMFALTLRERRWADARATLVAPVVLLGSTLVITLAHTGELRLDGGPAWAVVFGWGWLAAHLAALPLALLVWSRQRAATGGEAPVRAPMGPDVSVPTAVMGLVLVGLAIAMWVAPGPMGRHWAWQLNTLDAQLLGAWLFTFGAGAFHAVWERDVRRITAGFFTDMTLSLLSLVALARYADDVRWGSWLTWVYLVVLAGLLIAGLTGRFLALPAALAAGRGESRH
ncbi:hypothetical protein E1287_28590 [Actinomadura sp. KC06]|uniref:hypothetical protein n=1 Tax=Actinomadura sp. KC06 TaxID=2530369 RepID=UPI001047328A|nr:hypothetical protein [Actinomadura sp. KC06]TDD30861.1 hypothetical protein E1287_28590 [Actinomadura sp. KC06]